MGIITYKHNIQRFDSRILNQYFKDKTLAVFDIETLGLNPMHSEMILSGFFFVDADGNAYAKQFFAETPEEEPQVLKATLAELKKYDYILTYNGKHFDIPFLAKRAELMNADLGCSHICNLDLYLILNGHSQIKSVVENLRQKTIEEYMGLSSTRKDEISGAESIDLYNEYVQCPDQKEKAALREKILLHNHDDLIQLYKLLPVILQCDFHKAMNALGFPVWGICGWPNFIIKRSRISNGNVVIEGSYAGDSFSYTGYFSFSEAYYSNFEKDGSFTFSIPVENLKGSRYADLRRLLPMPEVLSKYPGYVNGYMVLYDKNETSYLDLNMFTIEFLKGFMQTHPFA